MMTARESRDKRVRILPPTLKWLLIAARQSTLRPRIQGDEIFSHDLQPHDFVQELVHLVSVKSQLFRPDIGKLVVGAQAGNGYGGSVRERRRMCIWGGICSTR